VPHHVHNLLNEGDSKALLSAPACLAEEELNSDLLGHSDLLVFTFIGILPEMSWHERRRTPAGSQDILLMYILPEAWQSHPPRVGLVNHSREILDLELVGMSQDRGYISMGIQLPPEHLVRVEQPFARITLLTTRQIPTGTISIQGAGSRSHLVPARGWANLWVEVSAILVAGFCTVGEFRLRASRLHHPDPPWSRLLIPARGMSISVQDLSPLADLSTIGLNRSSGQTSTPKGM
jgi:hypothetical protein